MSSPSGQPRRQAANPKKVQQTGATVPRKRAAASKQAPRKRQAIGADIIGSETSLAERRRRAPTCSLASLRDIENEETLESDFVGFFGVTSDSHDTWGKTEVAPIAATKRKGRRPQANKLSDKGYTDALFGYHNAVEPRLPNSPDRSFFLRFPLEIRERIYATFLLYKTPIVVKYDLEMVESLNLRTHPILRICKQIAVEASNYIYRSNVFRVILRDIRLTNHIRENFIIDNKFLSRLKDIVIECRKDSYSFDWYEELAISLEKLVEAKAILNSLTFIMIPQKVGYTTTALGNEANPTTYADFFHFPGRLMRAFRKIPCKKLNIVIRKFYEVLQPRNQITMTDLTGDVHCSRVSQDSRFHETDATDAGPIASEEYSTDHVPTAALPSPEPTLPDSSDGADGTANPHSSEGFKMSTIKRFLISLDLTYLARGPINEGGLRNPATVDILRRKSTAIRLELSGLKKRFEGIFDDDAKACEEGTCRLMRDDEKITDILTLDNRY